MFVQFKNDSQTMYVSEENGGLRVEAHHKEGGLKFSHFLTPEQSAELAAFLSMKGF